MQHYVEIVETPMERSSTADGTPLPRDPMCKPPCKKWTGLGSSLLPRARGHSPDNRGRRHAA